MKSKYKGVSWNKKHQRWVAYIRHNYVMIHLGLFDDEEEAFQAYLNKRKELYREENLHPNFFLKTNKITIHGEKAHIHIYSPEFGEKIAIIDKKDIPLMKNYRWRAHSNYNTFYARAFTDGRKQSLMHVLLNPQWEKTDHINRNGLNNSRENLRECNSFTNGQNRTKNGFIKGKPTSSKYKGVTYHKTTEKWRVRISVNGKRINLGNFNNEIKAAKAYNEAAIKYFKYPRLNVIE